jgi:hypothetical protein
VLDRFKMAKHCVLHIEAGSFRFERKHEQIANEAALDGFYVLRTNVPETRLDADAAAVEVGDKTLTHVQRANRSI